MIRKLLESKLSRLIVVESGNPVGIITEKDVGLFLLSETSKQGLDDISISKIMKPILYVDEKITPKAVSYTHLRAHARDAHESRMPSSA